ncbi:protein kinase domain-containing protein [Streptomyces iconiensis]|uniref:non-specific serine/threonine protein kinase n=1 Tax=Streptomyces iconiensis TaxID=1384038 RepID=A0ABT6ZP60_9ACTN|nr:protein kinase [Streptomyces iconiensis]MDJ1130451.1 protein kinase [Streptomyces iconiensis]
MGPGEANGGELIGKVLGERYRVTSVVGRGGMGVVARAVDEVLGREVAVKILRAFTDTSAFELSDLRDRMKREAQAAARIRHGGVVTVHDVTEDGGLPVIVMELVDGPSLDDVLSERGTLEPREAAAIGAKLMDALDAAHQVGVLHRDVKPGNVLLERGGRVVLTDFGIASMGAQGDDAVTKLTRSGDLVGSLDFLPPERAQGREPGPASDIWSLGMTLYAAVEGTWPFRRTSVWSTLAAIVTEPLTEPRQAGALTPVLHALMAKDPANRPDAGQAREMLEQIAAGGTLNLSAPPPAPSPSTSATPGAPASPATPAFGPPPASAYGQEPPAYGQEAPAYGRETPAYGPAAGPVPGPAASAFGPPPPPHTASQPGGPYPGGRQLAGQQHPGQPPVGPPGAADGAARSAPDRARRRSRTLIAAAVAAVLLAGGGVTYALTGNQGGTDDDPKAPQAAAPSGKGSGEPDQDKKDARKKSPSASPSHDVHKKPSSAPPQRPSRPGEERPGDKKPDRKPRPGDKDGTTGPSQAPPPKPRPISKSCTGWTHKNPKPGTYGIMSGSYHLTTGPYQRCSAVTLAKSGAKLWYHCSVVNARGNNWTYVRIAGTNTTGWMSNDNLTRQSGPSTRC